MATTSGYVGAQLLYAAPSQSVHIIIPTAIDNMTCAALQLGTLLAIGYQPVSQCLIRVVLACHLSLDRSPRVSPRYSPRDRDGSQLPAAIVPLAKRRSSNGAHVEVVRKAIVPQCH
jgi:hypothetical protein